ncbi:MAG: hypothetical protein M3298_01645 [Thermoproteota archaeon]|jgi:hypothetical protein|nr:hypothetical protein [Thermoproteota archaeon]MDQ3806851.1 hypothetical protein [Thermoproteota archaeon]MDQ5842580.1 hypothetical protein [Thermoproteota archaeon]
MASSEGPRILWEQLKGKKVKTNDGHDVGEIKEVTQNYIRLEKGVVNKDKLWIPKYLADAYDGKVLWLVIGNDELARGYSYTTEPAREQYTQDFEAFKATPYGQRIVQLPDFEQNIRMTEERKSNTDTGEEYKNIRDLE